MQIKKHESSASLAFVRGIDRWPVNSPHKGPVTRKMFPFDDVIMEQCGCARQMGFHDRENKIVIAIPCQINGMWFDGTVSNVMHLLSNWDIYGWDHVGQLVPALFNPLTHWGRDKLDAIFYTTFSNGFSWMKMCEFRLEFHWSLFLRFQLIIFQHWLR